MGFVCWNNPQDKPRTCSAPQIVPSSAELLTPGSRNDVSVGYITGREAVRKLPVPKHGMLEVASGNPLAVGVLYSAQGPQHCSVMLCLTPVPRLKHEISAVCRWGYLQRAHVGASLLQCLAEEPSCEAFSPASPKGQVSSPAAGVQRSWRVALPLPVCPLGWVPCLLPGRFVAMEAMRVCLLGGGSPTGFIGVFVRQRIAAPPVRARLDLFADGCRFRDLANLCFSLPLVTFTGMEN